MVSRKNRDYIAVQLIQTKQMLALLDNDPIMSLSLKQKQKDLETQLEKCEVGENDTKVNLLFYGKPVKGSLGIDAAFVGKVVVPFQNMVSAEYAYRLGGAVGKRGQMNNKNESKLFLTSLTRGSFGIELTKLDSNDLLEDYRLTDSLLHIAKLVASSAKSDEDFAAELDGTTPRTIQSLKEFFKVVADDEAGVTIESGRIRCELNQTDVKRAYERVSITNTSYDENKVTGILKGLLLESWQFDFVDTEGKIITGKINEDLTEEQVSQYNATYFNKPCIATLKAGKILFKNGREKISYTLLAIE